MDGTDASRRSLRAKKHFDYTADLYVRTNKKSPEQPAASKANTKSVRGQDGHQASGLQIKRNSAGAGDTQRQAYGPGRSSKRKQQASLEQAGNKAQQAPSTRKTKPSQAAAVTPALGKAPSTEDRPPLTSDAAPRGAASRKRAAKQDESAPRKRTKHSTSDAEASPAAGPSNAGSPAPSPPSPDKGGPLVSAPRRKRTTAPATSTPPSQRSTRSLRRATRQTAADPPAEKNTPERNKKDEERAVEQSTDSVPEQAREQAHAAAGPAEQAPEPQDGTSTDIVAHATPLRAPALPAELQIIPAVPVVEVSATVTDKLSTVARQLDACSSTEHERLRTEIDALRATVSRLMDQDSEHKRVAEASERRIQAEQAEMSRLKDKYRTLYGKYRQVKAEHRQGVEEACEEMARQLAACQQAEAARQAADEEPGNLSLKQATAEVAALQEDNAALKQELLRQTHTLLLMSQQVDDQRLLIQRYQRGLPATSEAAAQTDATQVADAAVEARPDVVHVAAGRGRSPVSSERARRRALELGVTRVACSLVPEGVDVFSFDSDALNGCLQPASPVVSSSSQQQHQSQPTPLSPTNEEPPAPSQDIYDVPMAAEGVPSPAPEIEAEAAQGPDATASPAQDAIQLDLASLLLRPTPALQPLRRSVSDSNCVASGGLRRTSSSSQLLVTPAAALLRAHPDEEGRLAPRKAARLPRSASDPGPFTAHQARNPGARAANLNKHCDASNGHDDQIDNATFPSMFSARVGQAHAQPGTLQHLPLRGHACAAGQVAESPQTTSTLDPNDEPEADDLSEVNNAVAIAPMEPALAADGEMPHAQPQAPPAQDAPGIPSDPELPQAGALVEVDVHADALMEVDVHADEDLHVVREAEEQPHNAHDNVACGVQLPAAGAQVTDALQAAIGNLHRVAVVPMTPRAQGSKFREDMLGLDLCETPTGHGKLCTDRKTGFQYVIRPASPGATPIGRTGSPAADEADVVDEFSYEPRMDGKSGEVASMLESGYQQSFEFRSDDLHKFYEQLAKALEKAADRMQLNV